MAGRKKAIDPSARFSATQPMQKVVALNWNRAIKDKPAFREAIRNAICRTYMTESPTELLGFHASLLGAMQAIGEDELALMHCSMSFRPYSSEVNGVFTATDDSLSCSTPLHKIWNSSMIEVVTHIGSMDEDERTSYIDVVKCALGILCLPFYSDSESLISSHSMCHVEHPKRFCTTAALTMFCTLCEVEFDPD